MSLVCNECGTFNEDDAQFCVGCGAVLSAQGGQAQQTYQQPYEQQTYQQQSYEKTAYQKPQPQRQAAGQNGQGVYIPQGNGRFVDAGEVAVATLTNGRALNLVSGEGFRKEDAVLTNKRMYYNHTDGLINLSTTEEKINVRDITGTKINDWNPRMILVIAALLLLIGIFSAGAAHEAGVFWGFFFVAAIVGIVYLVLRRKFLRIEYAGGHIDFSVKKYNMANIREFQRCIHALKDTME